MDPRVRIGVGSWVVLHEGGPAWLVVDFWDPCGMVLIISRRMFCNGEVYESQIVRTKVRAATAAEVPK